MVDMKEYDREDGFISETDAITIAENDPKLTEEQREIVLDRMYDSLRKGIAERLDGEYNKKNLEDHNFE
jgi:hypothetical protein